MNIIDQIAVTPAGDGLHKMIQCSIFGWPEGEISKAHQVLYQIEHEAKQVRDALVELVAVNDVKQPADKFAHLRRKRQAWKAARKALVRTSPQDYGEAK